MKTKVILLGLLLAISGSVSAQLNIGNLEKEAEGTATGSTISSLLTGLGSNLKTSSLTTAFAADKSSWLNSAKSTTDASSGSTLLSKLAAGLKSTAFTSGWAAVKDKWFASAKTTNTNSGLKTLASQLTQYISTSSFTSPEQKSVVEGLIGAVK